MSAKKRTKVKAVQSSSKHKPKPKKTSIKKTFTSIFYDLRARQRDFLNRRPHRSLKLTRRRDYQRSLKLPGYFVFTLYVTQQLWKRRVTFGLLAVVFFALTLFFGMLGSQDTYSQMRELMRETAPKDLIGGEVSKAGIILMTSVTNGLNGKLDPTQQIIAGFMGLYVWLTVVWLLRNYLANKRVNLRDGLYSAGAPILSTFLMFIIMLIQLIPMAIAIIVASTAWQTGFIDGGAASMAATLALALIIALSLYWVTSTFLGLVIVTLPGMYPFRALSVAGDVVVGRRLRILYRLVWMMLVVLSWWVVIMIPIILLDGWIKSVFQQIEAWPIVPIALLAMMTFTIIWTAAYIYLLYRKIVDDDAAPA